MQAKSAVPATIVQAPVKPKASAERTEAPPVMSVPSPTCGGTGDALPAERKKASFDIKILEELMNARTKGAGKATKARELFAGPPFDNEILKDYRSYEDKFKDTAARTAAAVKLLRDPANRKLLLTHMGGGIQMRDMFATGGAAGIHFSMFLTFLKTNATKEQQEVWLEKAQEAKYFGAYAQTELGHGSNVRGLETIATFDKETDEFVIHSPTLTSLKWWPTGMYACTHGVVFANLVIDGKNYGFHGFMVQFRDDQGNLMPGVEIGEMGPKINADNTNIGYARFTNVRIPRFNMFAKYQQVARDGTYTAPPKAQSKFRYISMMQIRMFIVGWSYRDLAKAATIAIRYSAVRLQGFKDSTAADPLGTGIGENCVLDYKVQQYRCFKALASAYCFYFSAAYITGLLMKFQGIVASGTDEEKDQAAGELPELHATLCGLKVWSTLWAHTGIEDCRKACGGQGYLRSSGISDLSTDFAEPATVEGEQVILSLQLARFLIKSVDDCEAKRPLFGSVQYLSEAPLGKVSIKSWQGQLEVLIGLMKDRTNRFARKLAVAFKAASQKLPFDEALNSVALLAYKAAECHSAYIFVRQNYDAVQQLVSDEPVKAVLLRLLELVCLTQMRENAGDWMNALGEEHVDLLTIRINEVLNEIRPDAVALVDSFGFDDYQLQSTLGRHDGNVYEAIYQEAKLSPLNQTPKMVGWEHFGEIFDKDFLREGMKIDRKSVV